ncbi:hypothetical protein J3R83DRAFT_5547 [Lanmaoa asiatica]|nr:hypothetical protein J3R83DRAFT_5547 [Lanmaoa asiatica]
MRRQKTKDKRYGGPICPTSFGPSFLDLWLLLVYVNPSHKKTKQKLIVPHSDDGYKMTHVIFCSVLARILICRDQSDSPDYSHTDDFNFNHDGSHDPGPANDDSDSDTGNGNDMGHSEEEGLDQSNRGIRATNPRPLCPPHTALHHLDLAQLEDNTNLEFLRRDMAFIRLLRNATLGSRAEPAEGRRGEAEHEFRLGSRAEPAEGRRGEAEHESRDTHTTLSLRRSFFRYFPYSKLGSRPLTKRSTWHEPNRVLSHTRDWSTGFGLSASSVGAHTPRPGPFSYFGTTSSRAQRTFDFASADRLVTLRNYQIRKFPN